MFSWLGVVGKGLQSVSLLCILCAVQAYCACFFRRGMIYFQYGKCMLTFWLIIGGLRNRCPRELDMEEPRSLNMVCFHLEWASGYTTH